jgi:hypothetical protein
MADTGSGDSGSSTYVVEDILAHLDIHDNQLKNFIVDKVTTLPTVIEGKMIYYDGDLYYGKSGVWEQINDTFKVKVVSLDNAEGYLADKVFGKNLNVGGEVDAGIIKLLIENPFNEVQNMDDVEQVWKPGLDVLFGWDEVQNKFRPIYLDDTLQIARAIDTEGTLTLRRNGISQDKGWAIKGAAEVGEYPGYFVHSQGEDKKLNGVSVRCESGSCVLQVRVNGTPMQFNVGVDVPVNSDPKTIPMNNTFNLWHGSYIDIKVLSVDSVNGCTDLAATVWIWHT